MTTVKVTFDSSSPEALSALKPRSDLLIEESSGDGTWTQTKGPFKSYSRSVVVDEQTGAVSQTVDFALDAPFWSFALTPLFKSSFKNEPKAERSWWPTEVVSHKTVRIVSILAFYSLMSGFLGALITAEIAFIGDDMGIASSQQVDILAWTRIGIVISIFVLPLADRFGRKPLLAWVSVAAITFTVFTSFFENVAWIISTQAIARAFITAMYSLSILAALEQVPKEWRARSITAMTATAGIGIAISTLFLPLNDININLWRVPFIFSGILIFGVIYANRNLDETSRFVEREQTEQVEVKNTKFTAKDKRNLVLVGIVSFFALFFSTPFSSVRNTFLEEEKGWTATEIGFFQAGATIPAGIALFLAGLLADRLGRKTIGITGLAMAIVFAGVAYSLPTFGLFTTTMISLIGSGLAFPAIYGYKSELFDTRIRSKANAYIDVLVVAGSGLGLLATARLINIFNDSIGAAIGILAIVSLPAVFVFSKYLPETANRELEDLSSSET